MRCLERDPAARYASGHEIEADIGRERSTVIAAPGMLPTVARSRRRAVLAGTVAVVLIAAAVAPIALRRIRAGRPALVVSAAAVPTARIAVLPFVVAGDAALGSTAAGLDESLSSKLFALKQLAVAAPSAVERASHKKTLAEIGKDAGASLLVTGTVQGSPDHLRVTAHLEDVARGESIWSDEFTGVAADILTLEDRIYAALVAHLPVKPTDAEIARTVTHPTENLEAYAAYLNGRRAMRAEQNLANVQAAIDDYSDALKKDPRFALAYAGIADSSLRMYRATKEQHWASDALSAAQQAQSLDDNLLEVHIALGNVYQATGRTRESIVELKRAAELAPNSDDALRRLGRAYLASGMGEAALAAYRQAVAVNPFHWVNSDSLGAAYLQLGQYDAAIAAFNKVISLAPDNVNGYNDVGAAYLRTARYGEAIRAFQKALDIQKIPNTYTNLGIAFADNAQFDQAVPMFEKAVELQPNAEVFVGNLADGYRWAGQRDTAKVTYDRAIGLALKALQVNPRDATTKGNLALYYAKKGDAPSARRFMNDARAIDATSADLLYDDAVMSAVLGDVDRAFAGLARARKAGLPYSSIESDPDLRGLRSDARFASLKTVKP